MCLEQVIKQEAARQGFILAGITTPDPPAHIATFGRWLEAGLHGEMAYLASAASRLRRADPRQVLPTCQSIVVLGIPYLPAKPETADYINGSAPSPLPPLPSSGGKRGKIAAYAWGKDYHSVLKDRLHALTGFIEAQLGRPVASRCYTDTGPLLERDLAQRYGLGWVGKNTCLVNPRLGSYFFLAELLLDVVLEPDPPFDTDYCGACTRCIRACPTGCIRPDRTLDARRCISYLTIELKGTIPLELRPSLGEWVFGCDICQQVCPWNRFAPVQVDPAFTPPPGFSAPDLAAELLLTAGAFAQKFKESPLRRARHSGYLRNVAVALGNQADPAAVPVLQQLLAAGPEPLVREHAAWALEMLKSHHTGCTEGPELQDPPQTGRKPA